MRRQIHRRGPASRMSWLSLSAHPRRQRREGTKLQTRHSCGRYETAPFAERLGLVAGWALTIVV
jgi:hypothetical protein